MKRVLQTIILALILPVSCGIQERNMTTAYYGPWQKVQFEGTVTDSVKTKYLLTVKYRAHSGDGTFTLQLSEADSPRGKNKAVTYTGRRYTQRGIPSDNDATIWQLVCDDAGGNVIFNFLYDKTRNSLLLLDENFEKPTPESDHRIVQTKPRCGAIADEIQ